jgi:hypothetical protein
MWSFIKCVESPEYITPNTYSLVKYRVLHLGLSKRRLFFKLYLDGTLLKEERLTKMIWFMTFLNYTFLFKISPYDSEIDFNTCEIKVEVGYEN